MASSSNPADFLRRMPPEVRLAAPYRLRSSQASTPCPESPRRRSQRPASRRLTAPNHDPRGSQTQRRGCVQDGPFSPGPRQGNNAEDLDIDEDDYGDGDSSDDAGSEIIVAVEMKENGPLGCAYFVAETGSLHLLEEVASGTVEILESLFIQIQPTTVVMSARSSEAFSEFVNKGAVGTDGTGNDAILGAYAVRQVASAEFKYEAGKERLIGLNISTANSDLDLFATVVEDDESLIDAESGMASTGRVRRALQLGCTINFESVYTIGCAGAVIGDLQRRQTTRRFPFIQSEDGTFTVKSIAMFTLASSMLVNADTLASLQVLQSELHPNRLMRGPAESKTGAKESLSLYGLFHLFAGTPQGKIKLRQWFVRPMVDIDIITERQKAIKTMLRPENAALLEEITNQLKGIKNMKNSVLQLKRGSDVGAGKRSAFRGVWGNLQRFTMNCLDLWKSVSCLVRAGEVAEISKLQEGIDTGALHRILAMISSTIDFQESRREKKTVIKRGVDNSLGRLQIAFEELQFKLVRISNEMQKECKMVGQPAALEMRYIPTKGFFVRGDLRLDIPYHDLQEALGFDENQTRLVQDGFWLCKNHAAKALDNDYGDIAGDIEDRVIEVIHSLSLGVLEHEEAILNASNCIGEFDSLVALAVGARRFGWKCPKITEDNILEIYGGRHPLQELVVPSFIANDCAMQSRDDQAEHLVEPAAAGAEIEKHPNVLVVTGPNHSGKSVYLKQVALIVYLAHIGSFVPAVEATIGLTDKILTRISTRESVSRNQSAFAIDLSQVAFAMNGATQRSLVAIDEFGKGTNPTDGASLMAALIDHFHSRREDRPKVLIATHFHEVFDLGFIRESPGLRFAMMDVHVETKARDEERPIVYLYKVRAGRSAISFGTLCAKLNGIDPTIVERADTLSDMIARNEDLKVVCARLSPTELEGLGEAEIIARRFIGWELEGENEDHDVRGILQRVLRG